MIKTGQRYIGPSGVEMVVTKGGEGELTDGSIPLQVKGSEEGFPSEYSVYSPPQR